MSGGWRSREEQRDLWGGDGKDLRFSDKPTAQAVSPASWCHGSGFSCSISRHKLFMKYGKKLGFYRRYDLNF